MLTIVHAVSILIIMACLVVFLLGSYKGEIMDPTRDLTQKEKEEIRSKAIRFYNDHEDYIVTLITIAFYPTPPSRLEIFTPDLWSGANWKWFLKYNY